MSYSKLLIVSIFCLCFAASTALQAGVATADTAKAPGQDNLDSADFVTTKSGLRYLVYKAGEGRSPAANDLVTMRYHGTLENGDVFDTNVDREPTSLTLNRVISGLSEGLQTMKVGGRSMFYVPAKLAYGEAKFGSIPPNSNLIYQVELLQVVVLNVPTDMKSVRTFEIDSMSCGKPPVLPKSKTDLRGIQDKVQQYSNCTRTYHTRVMGQMEALAVIGQKASDAKSQDDILKKLKQSEEKIQNVMQPAIDYLQRYHELASAK